MLYRVAAGLISVMMLIAACSGASGPSATSTGSNYPDFTVVGKHGCSRTTAICSLTVMFGGVEREVAYPWGAECYANARLGVVLGPNCR